MSLLRLLNGGVIDDHPMKAGNIKMYREEKSKLRTPSVEEVLDSIDPYNCPNPMLRAYVGIKTRTGLRMTDILGLTKSDITSEDLTVVVSKTRNKTGQTLKFLSAREWPGLMRFGRSALPNRPIIVGASSMVVWAKTN